MGRINRELGEVGLRLIESAIAWLRERGSWAMYWLTSEQVSFRRMNGLIAVNRPSDTRMSEEAPQALVSREKNRAVDSCWTCICFRTQQVRSWKLWKRFTVVFGIKDSFVPGWSAGWHVPSQGLPAALRVPIFSTS